jgi:hypothetical protein
VRASIYNLHGDVLLIFRPYCNVGRLALLQMAMMAGIVQLTIVDPVTAYRTEKLYLKHQPEKVLLNSDGKLRQCLVNFSM